MAADVLTIADAYGLGRFSVVGRSGGGPHALACAEALRTSEYGWIDDVLAFCSPWGFDPATVRVPVLLWHGASDVFSPASHARWLADRIPSAAVVVQAGSLRRIAP